MAVALLSTPTPMSAEQYDRVIDQLEASGAAAPKGRRFHACFGPDHHLMTFEVWDSMEEFQGFGATLMPILAKEQIELVAAEPLEIHSIIEGSEMSALRKTIEVLREKAFFRRPVEKFREKIHKAKQTSSEQDKHGGSATE